MQEAILTLGCFAKKKRADEESIKFAPVRIQELRHSSIVS